MINAGINISGSRTAELNVAKNEKSFFKDFLPYSIGTTILWGINEKISTMSPESVVWCGSKSFQILAALCVFRCAWNLCKSDSPPTSLSTRNVQKLVATQEEVDSLRAEISRLQQELAARQGLASIGTGSAPHSQSIAEAADTSISRHLPHEPDPVDQHPPQNWVI